MGVVSDGVEQCYGVLLYQVGGVGRCQVVLRGVTVLSELPIPSRGVDLTNFARKPVAGDQGLVTGYR